MLEAIVKAEGITVSDEDLEKEMERMAKAYNMELDKVKEILGEEEKKQISLDIAVQKAIDFVTEQAVEKEA